MKEKLYLAGVAGKELLPGKYAFRLKYGGFTLQKSNVNIVDINPLNYETIGVIVRLEDNNGNELPGGISTYNAFGWKQFDLIGTDGNTSGFELLPGKYSFQLTYDGQTDQLFNVDVSTVNPVVFIRTISFSPKITQGGDNSFKENERSPISLKAFPNPFTEGLTLKLFLPYTSRTTISVFNTQGQLVHQVFSGQLEAGVHQKHWSGKDAGSMPFPAGMY